MIKNKTRTLSKKELTFVNNLEIMCDIVAADAINQIQNKEVLSGYKKEIDIKFLEDQRSTRLMKISDKIDTHHQKKLESYLKGKAEDESQRVGRQSSINAHTLITVAAESGEGDPPTGPPILLLRDVSPSSGAPAVQLWLSVYHRS